MVLFVLYVVLRCEPADEILYGVTIRMKPLQQYFYTVLFGLYVVLSCESVHEILWCDYSNEISLSSTLTWCYLLVCGSNF